MKIYITGSVAGGKSTLARELSRMCGVPCFALDEVVHERNKSGDRRRAPEEIEQIFAGILALPSYIVEDTGRVCFSRGFDECDEIVLLNPKKLTRRLQIMKRFARQKLGLEKSSYKPTLKMLRNMFRWADNFDSGEDGLIDRLKQYGYKLTTLKSNRDIEKYKFDIISRLKK